MSLQLRWDICVFEIARACTFHFEKLKKKCKKDAAAPSAFFSAGDGIRAFKEELAKVPRYNKNGQSKVTERVLAQLKSYHPEFDALNTFRLCIMDVMTSLGGEELVQHVQIYQTDLETSLYDCLSRIAFYLETEANAFYIGSSSQMLSIEAKVEKTVKFCLCNIGQKIFHRTMENFGAPMQPTPALQTPQQQAPMHQHTEQSFPTTTLHEPTIDEAS